MNAAGYLMDPCKASSLPFWKTEKIRIPDKIKVFRDDEYDFGLCGGKDEPYFKMIRTLERVEPYFIPDGYEIADCEVLEFARHINGCYREEHISEGELSAYKSHPVYDPALWIAVADMTNNKIVATGIAELDKRIGEGILEWIQVSESSRRKGLGKFLVCELIRRMQKKAEFVTVSGRLNSVGNPYALYQSCGFKNPVIWHVVTG